MLVPLHSIAKRLKVIIIQMATQIQLECWHSSVDSSAPTILPPWVQVTSTTSTFLSFIVNFCYICHVEIKKWPGLAPKKLMSLTSISHQESSQHSSLPPPPILFFVPWGHGPSWPESKVEI